MFSLPVSMIWVGKTHIKSCPINTNIPIFVMVSGYCNEVLIMSILIVNSTPDSYECCKLMSGCILVVTATVYFAWNVAGGVWVSGVWKQWRTHWRSGELCNNNLYMFSFVLLLGYWVVTFPYFTIKGVKKLRYSIRGNNTQ